MPSRSLRFLLSAAAVTLTASACSPALAPVDGDAGPTTSDAPASRVDVGTGRTDAGSNAGSDAGSAGSDAGTPALTCINLSDAAARVQWTAIDANPSCYFFSGPTRAAAFHLGTRARIQSRDLLAFDGGAEFVRSYGGYQRDLACDDAAWTVRERFDGAWTWPETPGCDSRPVWRGTYSYTECSTGPDGTCTPAADDCTATATVEIRAVTDAELPPRPSVVASAAEIRATCTASCGARNAVRSNTNPGQPCEAPNPACVEDCVTAVAGMCGGEALAANECFATESNAFSCFDPLGRIMVNRAGPCAALSSAFSECDVNPEICVVRR
jgi:hypothetical protein